MSDNPVQPGDNVDESLPPEPNKTGAGSSGGGNAGGITMQQMEASQNEKKKMRQDQIPDNRKKELQTIKTFSEAVMDTAKLAVDRRLTFQFYVSGLLLAGGVLALGSAILLILAINADFLQSARAMFVGQSALTPNTAFLLIPSLISPVILAVLGFGLIGVAVGVNRYPVVQRGLLGISQFQHELAAGSGETRPLVQVVEETINHSRKTFLVQLRIGEAAFWVGLVALAIFLIRVAFGAADWTTNVTGVGGIVAWLFSFFNAQRRGIQKNLADITQLELGLVTIAKQISYLDQWLRVFVTLDNGWLPASLTMEARRSVGWGLQELQKGVFAAVGLVELYAQDTEKEDDADRRKLINEAVRRHTGLDGGGQVSELVDIAGDYAVALGDEAGVATLADLRKAGAKPDGRQKLSEATGIRPENILEFVQLADLMRVQSLTACGARLLRNAQINSPADLAKFDSKKLQSILADLNAKQQMMILSPTVEEVADWVEQAKNLPEGVTV